MSSESMPGPGHAHPDAAQTLASVQGANLRLPCDCGCGVRLTGRQKHFASRICCSRWYDAQHPRVNPPGLPREGTILAAMLRVMADGEWRTAHQIAEAVRAFPHSVSARLAEARKRGYSIETDARNGNSRRSHRFRLVR